MNKPRMPFARSASRSSTNSPFPCSALKTKSLFAVLAAGLLVAVANVWELKAIPIDLGPSGLSRGTDRIGFSGLNGTSVTGNYAVDFLFANNAFVRLFTITDRSFCANLNLQTSASELVGFLQGTAYLIDAHGSAIPGYGITGSASSSDGSMAIGFFPFFKDQDGTPNAELKKPLDFYGVHFDITFPVDPSFEVTGGQFFLTSGETIFGIGPNIPADIVPDAGNTALYLGLAILLLFAAPLSGFEPRPSRGPSAVG